MVIYKDIEVKTLSVKILNVKHLAYYIACDKHMIILDITPLLMLIQPKIILPFYWHHILLFICSKCL